MSGKPIAFEWNSKPVESRPANRLPLRPFDPFGKIPEFKYRAARMEPAEPISAAAQ